MSQTTLALKKVNLRMKTVVLQTIRADILYHAMKDKKDYGILTDCAASFNDLKIDNF